MPAPAGTKRVKNARQRANARRRRLLQEAAEQQADLDRVQGVQIHRPFVFGSVAHPFSASYPKPPSSPPEHTHNWTVYLRPLTPDHDLSHWLKKVQFKLHETYADNTILIESPSTFSISKTGWGEFEVQIKLFFVPESNEKAATLWHALKLHPYGSDVEKEEQIRRGEVKSECYEEIVFTEPVEAFYEILTQEGVGRGPGGGKGRGKGKMVGRGRAIAEVPGRETKENIYCVEMERREVRKMEEAGKTVQVELGKEKGILERLEREREELVKESEE